MNWLNQIVDDVTARHPEGEILLESGGSPSGTHHLGHMRELVTCDAILLELRRRGRQARHIYFVDDLDNLRKVPGNVPADYEKYLGYPLCDIPAPDGSDQSYADYFLQSLIDGCAALGIEVEFIRSHKKYREGFFVPAIERCLERIPQIRTALETVSGRQLEDGWSPIQVLEEGRLKKRIFISINKADRTIQYQDADGQPRTLRYDTGEVKLDWRLDWPGRWWLMHVLVEPSGRDHMTKGSSYDTGVEIMRDVYEADPPYPVSYDFINMVGDTKKMSASKGTGLDAVEGSKIMPPEVVRYFILRAAPLKRLYFDPVNGVVQLIDEFAAFAAKPDKTEAEKQLWYICTRGSDERRSVSRVPFSHLVASYQASLKDADKTLDVIKRTEYAAVAEEEADIIREELRFIDEWLRLRAPEDVKFALVEQVQAADFSDLEKTMLATLAQKVADAPADADGTYFHERIYELKDQLNLQPKDMFTTLYRAIIGKPSGPRAGWFLSILPRDWLVKRLRLEDASTAKGGDEPKATPQTVTTAQLTEGRQLILSDEVREHFPQASIGYVVVSLAAQPQAVAGDPLAEALQSLQERGITADNLTEQPQIATWRAAFKTFGVKPSKYLCSAEALTKRALKGNPAHVSPVVDAYNAVSIKNLVPMGALDLDKLHGDLTVRYGKEGDVAELLGIDDPVVVQPEQVVYADQDQIVTWLWNHRDAERTAVDDQSTNIVFLADSLLGATLAQQAIDQLSDLLQQMGVKVHASGVIGNLSD